jgi:NADP-dependent 3-hydroxy acid dehydrogenase YdfG
MTHTLPLADRVVVITGASAGIGAALARSAAARGAVVVAAARRKAELDAVVAACGPRALAHVVDVTQRDEVLGLAAFALQHCGHIDAWVNNAGRGITKAPSQLTDDDVDTMLTINVKSALWGVQAVLPHFQQRGQGHLVNVSSMLGRVPFAPPRAAYSAAKAWLNNYTASLRMELAATHPGIHVTLFSPGVVATEFGTNAIFGGVDSRSIPGAQPVEEVGDVLAEVLVHPRAEVYSRPQYHEQVAAYFTAADIGAFEAQALRRR